MSSACGRMLQSRHKSVQGQVTTYRFGNYEKCSCFPITIEFTGAQVMKHTLSHTGLEIMTSAHIFQLSWKLQEHDLVESWVFSKRDHADITIGNYEPEFIFPIMLESCRNTSM